MIVTLGPSTTEDVIRSFVELGVKGFRINSAHGNRDEWKGFVDVVRDSCGDCAILVDLRGPTIRVKSEKILEVAPGHRVVFSRRGEVRVNREEFFRYVDVGDKVLMDDGRFRMLVIEKSYDRVVLQALDNGIIKDNKTLTIKGKELPLDILDQHDRDVIGFARRFADIIGLSYVRDERDVIRVREEAGGVWLMAKIETKSAVKNIDKIIVESDMVMVARGDLGVNFDLSEVPSIQRDVVSKSIKAGRPVYVATQLLTSMVASPTPTRSEIVDIMTAVEQGVDGLILTNETAIGKYPVEAVKWLRKSISKVDGKFNLERKAEAIEDRFTLGIVELAEALGAPIYIYTKSGLTALKIARYRPKVDVVAGTDPEVVRRLSVVWGLRPVTLIARDHSEGLEELGKMVPKGPVLLTYGLYHPEKEHIIKLSMKN